MIAALREWWLRIRGTHRHDEVEEELRFHLEMAEHAALRRGGSVREARLRCGGLAQASEAVRDQEAFAWLSDFVRDSRHGIRALAKSPLFTAAATVSLALGIGANTAIFSVVNAAFLRPLPYAAPGRIAWVTEYNPRLDVSTVIMPDYAAWKLHNTTFERLAAHQMTLGKNLSAPNLAAERVQVGHVTPDFFAMLGVAPRIGRDFRSDEGEPGRNAVALIGDSLWRHSFQAGLDVVGMNIFLDGAAYTVIGVMPPELVYPDGASADQADQAVLWLPDAVDRAGSVPSRARRDVFVIGRLKDGIGMEQARANLETIARSMDGQYPKPFFAAHAGSSVRVLPLREHLTSGSRTGIYVLMGAVGCILLIVCANVANLSLARSVAREREIAIRAAIGASRFRVVRLLLAESLMLGAAGGLLGIPIAYAGTPALGFLLPGTIPHPIPIDPRVLGFAAVCSLATGILFGLAAAWTASRLDLNTALKEGGTHPMYRPNRSRLRGLLAVAQLALCLVLLSGAGLLMRTLVNLLNVGMGFDPRNVLLANFQLQPRKLYGPDRQRDFAKRVLAAVEALPGVRSAALTSEPPMGAPVFYRRNGFHAEGQPEAPDLLYMTAASDGYFRALRIPLLEGRPFTEGDGDGQEQVAILSQAAVRILFKDRNPLGRRIFDPRPLYKEKGNWLTVVGVVGDVRHDGLDEAVWPEIFRPFAQMPVGDMSLVVRGYSDPSALAPAIRRAGGAIDPQQPVFGMETMDSLLSGSVAERGRRAYLLASFALVSLAIAIVGVYGVMAYSVTRRTHEIGVRLALGARRRDVFTMVVGEGLGIALTGVAGGLALSLALTRVLGSFLFGVGPRDEATLVSASVALVVATCLASYVPARRATRVDPIRALRHE